MDNKQLQTWLKQHGFYQGKIDGIVGRQTKGALRKAQQYLADRGLYKIAVDGIFGKGTLGAITTYNKGKRYFNKHGVSFNIYDRNSMDNAVKALRAKGIRQVKVNGRVISLGSNGAFQAFYDTAADAIRGVRSKTLSDSREGNATSRARGIRNNVRAFNSTSAASNGGGSSLRKGNLDDLVMRYAYDKYHGTAVNDKDWGISYDYTPHSKLTLGKGITLHITNKYTPQQAARIAIGAGMASYNYNGRTYNTNLFTGQKGFSDKKTFDAYIENIRKTKGAVAAQRAYNAELARQYKTYGIDFNQLKNKTGAQWNSVFGVVPYGYNLESVGAIAKGQQAVQAPGATRQSSGVSTAAVGYRYTGKGSNGRFQYNNYGEWRNARIMAQSGLHNGGISKARAVTSLYSMGFPVVQGMRGQLTFSGARPNGNQVDRTNYYTLTDRDRGSSKMQAWVYNEVRKNPAAAYKYFQHIYGNRKRTSKGFEATKDRSYNFDPAKASRLAHAAGLTPYHLNTVGGDFVDKNPMPVVGAHDLWGSLKTFYENAYDENGKLRSDFSYSENGYNNRFDGGAYTVNVRGGKAVNAEDVWNVELGGISAGMNAGITSKKGHQGIPMIARFSKQGGLLQFITAFKGGGDFTNGKKKGDRVNTDQCAAWSNGTLRGLDYLISGNAWNLNDVDTLYNGYEGLKKPATYNREAIQKYNSAATDSVYTGFDSKSLDKSKPYVVNMFYRGSPAQELAFKEGRGVTGTHTGILSYKNGKWVVTHNIHGTIHEEPFIQLQNSKGKYGVTAIFSPRKKGFLSSVKHFFGFKYGGCIIPK